MGIRSGLGACALVVIAVMQGAVPAGADDAGTYRPPVEDRVSDPFRRPATAYGPGNRGLTYELQPGTPVHAAAPGRVVFAGWVAGTQHVTVLHDDGLRTSYSFLASVVVRRGADVSAGDVVGTGGAGFHFGVRDGDVYLDPASLFGTVHVRVRLVPHDEPAPPTDAGLLRERIALRRTVQDKGLLRRAVDWGTDLAARRVERTVGAVHVARELDPATIVVDSMRTLLEQRMQDCTAEDITTPARPAAGHVALLVAGYGSDSRSAAVDEIATDTLGYDATDVARFSYAGGRTPPVGAGGLATLATSDYDAADTFTDLRDHGVALADLVEAAAIARPGAPIDLLAHSQGGIVVRLALVELGRRNRLDLLGSVVTIGTPHRGVDLGTGALVAGPLLHRLLEPLTGWTGDGVDTDAPAVLQLAETSTLMLELQRDGVPSGVDFRTIGAVGDLVVTGDKTTVPGHRAAMVGLHGADAHSALPGAAATTREIALALAGQDPGCRSVRAAIVAAVVPQTLSFLENAVLTGAVVAASSPS